MELISIKRILKALLLSTASTAVLLVILAAVCTAVDLDNSVVRIITFAVSVICVFLWTLLSAKGVDRGGMIHGGITGILYGAVFVCLSAVCSGGFAFTSHTATMLFAVLLAGILGGVIGINSAK